MRDLVEFLDRETAEIDAFIADQHRFLDLLEERANAVGEHLLVGSEDSASFKRNDHDITWLAGRELPESFRRMKLAHVAVMHSGESFTSDDFVENGEIPVFGGGGQRGHTDSPNHFSDHVLVGRQGALCGKVFLAQAPFFATEHAIVTYPRFKVDLTWFEAMLRFMDLGQYSTSAAQPGISVDVISKLHLPVPSFERQTSIGRELTKMWKHQRQLTRESELAIELSQERRSALISAAVTGQIDVSDRYAAEKVYEEVESVQ